MSAVNQQVNLSMRVSPEARMKLESLAAATGRSKSYLAAEALDQYLETQTWQIQLIKEAVEKADSNKAQFIEHEEIAKWADNL